MNFVVKLVSLSKSQLFYVKLLLLMVKQLLNSHPAETEVINLEGKTAGA